MTAVVITGGHGFLGWHLACRLRAIAGVDPVRLGRREFDEDESLRHGLDGAATIYHLAGVNRADTDAVVEQGNVHLADRLARAIEDRGEPVHLVYANSVQSDLDNPYGRGKRRAGEILTEAVRRVGGTMADVVLPNLFGEHGRPSYNSVVATFAHLVATGGEPVVNEDRELPLLHAQAAAATLIAAGDARRFTQERPRATHVRVSAVLDRLRGFHDLYAVRGEIPDLSDRFSVELFNTYRSYLFPQSYPIFPTLHQDPRGRLFEAVRAHGGTGQAFVSTTTPGATRGDHYHLSKIERFMVVKGDAEIALRRLLHNNVVRFKVSGDRPGFVDMPAMWAHNITNVGSSELVTIFWADQLLDAQRPDQYPEQVERIEP